MTRRRYQKPREKPVNLDLVREVRKRLAKLVREHPELKDRADALDEDFEEIMWDGVFDDDDDA